MSSSDDEYSWREEVKRQMERLVQTPRASARTLQQHFDPLSSPYRLGDRWIPDRDLDGKGAAFAVSLATAVQNVQEALDRLERSHLSLEQCPATLAAMALNLGVFLWSDRLPVYAVAFDARRVFTHEEVYRIATSLVTHYDAVHLVNELGALALYGSNYEAHCGTAAFAVHSATATALAVAIRKAMWTVALRIPQLSALNNQPSVGMGPLLYAVQVLSLHQRNSPMPTARLLGIPGITMPADLVCYANVLFTKLLVPDADVMAPLSGIAAGVICSVTLNLLGAAKALVAGRAGLSRGSSELAGRRTRHHSSTRGMGWNLTRLALHAACFGATLYVSALVDKSQRSRRSFLRLR